MAGLKAIKLKIRSIEKTGKVTKAMEAVSASKMRKAQSRALSGRAFARAATSVLARLSGSRELANHPLVRGAEFGLERTPRAARVTGRANSDQRTCLYIVITSDKGLAGALNSAVLRATLADLSAKGFTAQNTSIIAIGRKANDFFAARGFNIEIYHPNTDIVDSALVSELVGAAAERFTSGKVGLVSIAYQNFFSTFEQRPTIRQILPLSLSELEAVVGDIAPVRGVFSQTGEESHPQSYTVEPSEEEVLAAIIPRLASIFVYHALLESQASEHSARMVAMKSASDKAEELEEAFTLQFNKARQAAITREVSEITGGMEAMSTN